MLMLYSEPDWNQLILVFQLTQAGASYSSCCTEYGIKKSLRRDNDMKNTSKKRMSEQNQNDLHCHYAYNDMFLSSVKRLIQY